MDVNSREAAIWSENMRLKSENEHLRKMIDPSIPTGLRQIADQLDGSSTATWLRRVADELEQLLQERHTQ